MSYKALVFVSLFCLVYFVRIDSSICDPEGCSSLPEHSLVEDFCVQKNWTMINRCCKNESVVTGLDLRNCSLRKTDILHRKPEDVAEIEILDLSENPIEEYDENDFDGWSRLDRLYLNDTLQCPGGIYSWASMSETKGITVCKTQLDYCISKNFTCPNTNGNDGSHCESHGPGEKNIYCVCNDGFHGYKCLRHGNFPKVAFGAGFAGATVGIAGFCWLTNRRLVKTVSTIAS